MPDPDALRPDRFYLMSDAGSFYEDETCFELRKRLLPVAEPDLGGVPRLTPASRKSRTPRTEGGRSSRPSVCC